MEFMMIELKPPYSMTLLATYASLALVIIDAANRVFEVFAGQNNQKQMITDIDSSNLSLEPTELKEIIKQEVVKEHSYSRSSRLEPFSLTPRMSIYYPVYDHHTSVGFLTIDFRHVELSVKQSLSPTGCFERIVSEHSTSYPCDFWRTRNIYG
ncbi:hypothetical protein [Desulfosporosinus sp. FKA]|uniref:hypothetical protein n=1 Tax=Desulfosporosinus sp. FKA TaxID=1969834 RepID=UPI001FA8DF82|nr:hypothetical protein [Desulfosporosinus sp. FKA]